MAGMSYTQAMSNVTNLRPDGDAIRTTRAKHIHGLLSDERWSIRQASIRLGMNNSVLASRVKGETAFLADELEHLARLLKRDPVEFYAEYLSAGAPENTGPGGSVTGLYRRKSQNSGATITPFPTRTKETTKAVA